MLPLLLLQQGLQVLRHTVGGLAAGVCMQAGPPGQALLLQAGGCSPSRCWGATAG